ncbi:MAG: DUF3857 domain-containing protein [Bacteroidota bacterium]
MKKALLLTLLMGSALFCQAQYEKYKYGKISDEEMSFTEAPGHPDADAYTLFDRLAVSMMISPTTGSFELRETLHRRVKLFKESSFDRADVVIGYYEGMNIGSIKAAIYLPDGEEIKLKNSDIKRDEIEDGFYECRFTFPQVTEGAIIEYTYELRTEEFSLDRLPTYYFQESIPARWSEYTITKPDGFTYIDLATMHGFDIHETDMISRGVGNGGQAFTYSYDRYVMKDVPPMEYEPYTNNTDDYMPRIRKQLQYINWQGFAYDPEMSTWEELAEDIRGTNLWRYASGRAQGNRFMDDLEPLIAGASSDTEKAMIAHRLLNNRLVWDREYRFLPSRTPNQIWDKREGNSAEINTAMLHALKQMGIEAHPLFVGLRGQGNPMEYYPLRGQFQHMLVLANLEGAYQIIDVAGLAIPFGFARIRALNHRAWLVTDETAQWVSIEPPLAEETILAEVTLDTEGMAEATLKTRSKGYFGSNTREDMVDAEDPLDGPFITQIAERYPEVELIEKVLPEADDPNKPFSYELEVKAPIGQAMDDMMYVSPLLMNLVTAEIVEDEERTYPIDMPYGFRKRYICSMTLPEGYEVAELPESSSMRSEDGSVSCKFSISQSGPTISMNLDFKVMRTLFAAEEYEMFRELFRQVNDLQESMLVLRKVK